MKKKKKGIKDYGYFLFSIHFKQSSVDKHVMSKNTWKSKSCTLRARQKKKYILSKKLLYNKRNSKYHGTEIQAAEEHYKIS
jgi:hypothetical protein